MHVIIISLPFKTNRKINRIQLSHGHVMSFFFNKALFSVIGKRTNKLYHVQAAIHLTHYIEHRVKYPDLMILWIYSIK